MVTVEPTGLTMIPCARPKSRTFSHTSSALPIGSSVPESLTSSSAPHESDGPHLCDDIVAGEFRHLFVEIGGRRRVQPVDNVLVLEDADVLERDGARHGMSRGGEAMGEHAAFVDQCGGNPVANHDRGQGQVGRGDAFRDTHEIDALDLI